ncbi:VCBS repeat-containing protein, partial [Streptomyces sp900105245]
MRMIQLNPLFSRRRRGKGAWVAFICFSTAILLGFLNPVQSTATAATSTTFAAATKAHDFMCVDEETCAVGDVNGDGKSDLISFVKSTRNVEPDKGDVWVALSSGSSFSPAVKWHDRMCVDEETCAVGDVNGDGKSDLISFVKSTRNVE